MLFVLLAILFLLFGASAILHKIKQFGTFLMILSSLIVFNSLFNLVEYFIIDSTQKFDNQSISYVNLLVLVSLLILGALLFKYSDKTLNNEDI